MTASRFCRECGEALESGVRFCRRCGTATPTDTEVRVSTPPPAVTGTLPPSIDAPAPLQPAGAPTSYCANCGSSQESGLAFCRRCGAPFGTAAGFDTAPSRKQNTGLLVGGAAAVIAIIVVIVLAGGGGKDSDSNSSLAASAPNIATPVISGTVSAGGSTSSGSASSGGSSSTKGSVVAPAQMPASAASDKPGAKSGSNATLGANNVAAAKQINDALKAAGDTNGITAFVYPMKESQGNLLDLEVDGSKLSASNTSGNGSDKLLAAVANSPAMKSANITQVALNVTGVDAKGKYLLTIALPASVLPAMANGTISQSQAQQQVKFQITRG